MLIPDKRLKTTAKMGWSGLTERDVLEDEEKFPFLIKELCVKQWM